MEYIDLGLPSGNLWAVENEEGYYTFDEAVAKFEDNLPTNEDFDELLKHCWKRWDDERKGLEFMGDNEAKVFLPAAGYRSGSDVRGVQDFGNYWSASYDYTYYAYCIDFDSGRAGIYDSDRSLGYAVRLIKRGGTQ